MVQGTTKNLKARSPKTSGAAAKKDMKKGRRVIAPKKAVAVKQAKLHKELSAKINRSVEAQMVSAASTGKLTIMKSEGQQPEASGSKKK
ncbi:hypothetical protein AURDEDRAFT_116013 [Auricularia subglabra TFB-10046 SS5]|nr:hypothetical protein AURDEDRAFT_116013 [Auricularia subglabra TFB-10046 SS5]